MTVRVRAWCRVDLAGGTLDIWPVGLLHRGARTVNLAVEVPVDVELEPDGGHFVVEQDGDRVAGDSAEELAAHPSTALIGEVLSQLEAPPVAVRVHSASPRGGGLGASSALTVALITGIDVLAGRPRSSPHRVSALARDLEARLMGLPTGRQDHYPALLGGALDIAHEPGGEVVHRLEIDLERLAGSLVVAYTGRSHFSAGMNWQVVRRRLDGDPVSVELFDGIREAATLASEALQGGDLAEVGRQMSRDWAHRRRLAEGVSTPEIESLLRAAMAAGAWGGKATGAGGGGCIAVLAPVERRADVELMLEAGGARLLPARPAAAGLESSG